MDCQNVEELLSAFLENDLPEQQHKDIQQHLNSCPECMKIKEKLENVLYLCEDLEEDVPFFLKNRLYLISETEEEVSEPLLIRKTAFLRWAAAMIGALVLLLNFFYFTNVFPAANRTMHGMTAGIERIVVETGAFLERVKENDSNPFLSIFRTKPVKLKDHTQNFLQKEKGDKNG